MPAARTRALRTGMAAMVAQFGDDALEAVVDVVGLTRHDERDLGALRHAEELSTTTAPAAANWGVLARGGARGEHGNVDGGEVGRRDVLDDEMSWPLKVRVWPAMERADEKKRIVSTSCAFEQGAHDSADSAGGADDAATLNPPVFFVLVRAPIRRGERRVKRRDEAGAHSEARERRNRADRRSFGPGLSMNDRAAGAAVDDSLGFEASRPKAVDAA